MIRLVFAKSIFVCLLLCAGHAEGQVVAGQERGVIKMRLTMDDDWSFQQLWDTYVWGELEDALRQGILSNIEEKDVGDDSQSETGEPSAFRPSAFTYRFGSIKEDSATAAREELVSTLLGAMFPGASVFADILSDYRMSFGVYPIPHDD